MIKRKKNRSEAEDVGVISQRREETRGKNPRGTTQNTKEGKIK
jgi:hypothetical protein